MSGDSIRLYQPDLGPPSIARVTVDRAVFDNGAWAAVRVPNWLGDCVMTMPAVYKLKQMLPADCRLAVVCRSHLAPIWQAAAWVDRVIGFSGSRLQGESAAELRNLPAAAGFVLPNSFGSAFDFFGKRMAVRVGRAGRGRRMLLTHTLPPLPPPAVRKNFHQLRHYLELVSVLGDPGWDASYEPLTVNKAPGFWQNLELVPGRKVLVLAPGAAYGPAKQWPKDYFHEVARQWGAAGRPVICVGTGSDRELGDEILIDVDGGINLAGKTDLNGLMTVLANAAGIVANDSGAMHLGAALGSKGVAVFGSTDPAATGPLGGHWIVLQGSENCCPCFDRVCRHTGAECRQLQSIKPDAVCRALESLVAE